MWGLYLLLSSSSFCLTCLLLKVIRGEFLAQSSSSLTVRRIACRKHERGLGGPDEHSMILCWRHGQLCTPIENSVRSLRKAHTISRRMARHIANGCAKKRASSSRRHSKAGAV